MDLNDDLIEQYAIRCARGNNGGEWSTHYTEEQKEFWRAFVRDLARDITAAAAGCWSLSIGSGPF